MAANPSRNVPAPVVALAAWLLPGAGYWLLGQRLRAVVVGLSIIALFIGGLLIGGVKVLDVPGYGDHGQPLVVVRDTGRSRDPRTNEDKVVTQDRTVEDNDPRSIGWVMQVHPVEEIRNKPWFIPQVLAGPLDLVASWGSVVASRPQVPGGSVPIGARSHARTNELGVLYTAVAGMLNLLAIIDAAYRAGQEGEE
jgi:hypothetical protein